MFRFADLVKGSGLESGCHQERGLKEQTDPYVQTIGSLLWSQLPVWSCILNFINDLLTAYWGPIDPLVPWYLGAIVPWYHGVMVPWHHGTMVPWYHGATVPWHHGTMVPWYLGTMVPWYHGTMAPWYHGTMVPWYHGTMVPW